MGLKITVVHRGIMFRQSSWMEPYIRKNTELRKTAANSFEKDFFKLMNNSVFGKKIENIRKRQNITLVDDRAKAVKLTSCPNFDRATIFDRNLIAVHMKKTKVFFNKPVYNCERFEPRSHFKSRLSLIVRVNVVLNRTVVDSD